MVSSALDQFLAENGNGETFDSLLAKPPIKEPVPFDGSHPLTEYFISSSHNTYLLANQLYGAASAQAYTTALHGLAARSPAKCVEIDVWHTKKKGLIITHGHTLTGSIPFKEAVEAIGNAVGKDDLPVFISLECHVELQDQPELVNVMKGVLGDKLVTTKLEHLEGKKVSPDDLRGRIVMMVEWYPPPGDPAEAAIKPDDDTSSDSSSEDDDDDDEDVKEMQQFKKTHTGGVAKICEQLEALGIYANSIKPKEGWLEREIINPLHVLINISESALLSLLKTPENQKRLTEHGHHHLRRCYPKGLRVKSGNLNPLPIWACGTQVVGINMQKWDKGHHLNAALFRDTQGYVLKPKSLRGGPKRTGKINLKLTVVGGDDIPHGEKDKTRSIYIVAELYTPSGKDQKWRSKTIKDHDGDPMFNQGFEWTFDNDDLIFLRLELKKDEWGIDDIIASYTVDVDRIDNGLHFWPLFDQDKGMPSIGRLLVDVHASIPDS